MEEKSGLIEQDIYLTFVNVRKAPEGKINNCRLGKKFYVAQNLYFLLFVSKKSIVGPILILVRA